MGFNGLTLSSRINLFKVCSHMKMIVQDSNYQQKKRQALYKT